MIREQIILRFMIAKHYMASHFITSFFIIQRIWNCDFVSLYKTLIFMLNLEIGVAIPTTATITTYISLYIRENPFIPRASRSKAMLFRCKHHLMASISVRLFFFGMLYNMLMFIFEFELFNVNHINFLCLEKFHFVNVFVWVCFVLFEGRKNYSLLSHSLSLFPLLRSCALNYKSLPQFPSHHPRPLPPCCTQVIYILTTLSWDRLIVIREAIICQDIEF